MPRLFALVFALCLSPAVFAQNDLPLQTSGTLIVVPAYGEVRLANDEARASFMIEEQDKDRTAAVNRVNQKMKQGAEIIRRADARAQLQTRNYFTYPIYADEGGQSRTQQGKTPQRQIVGWRVGQYLDVKTTNLEALPTTVAAAQRVLALNGLDFGLAEATLKKLEDARIAAAYANLSERLASIAKAMGRKVGDMVLDTVDFEGSGGYVPQAEMAPRMMSAKAMDAGQVSEPSFEPGETTLSMRVVGRARFK